MDRVCILLVVALVVFVPLLTARGVERNVTRYNNRSIKEKFLVVCSGMVIAVTSVLPITMCVRKAEGSAATKWCWAETLLLVLTCAFNIEYSDNIYSMSNAYNTKYSRLLDYFVFPLSIVLLWLRARCQCCLTARFPPCRRAGDHRRLLLLLLAGLGQVGFYAVDVFGDRGAGSLWSCGVVACAAFIFALFWLDRHLVIEHSVPYCMAYIWALSASVLGASYILGLFHRFQTEISVVFSIRGVDLSTLVTQVALTLFSSLVLSVCSQVTGRLTTERHHTVWRFPVLFALVGRQQRRRTTHT
jgi:hypothetical protein